MKKAIIFVIVIFLTGAVMADELTDGQLTTFTAGTPARASEVNANFDAIQAAVNDNDERLDAVEPLMPVAMGRITDAGCIENGYGIVSCAYDSTTYYYMILLADGPYDPLKYVTIVTAICPLVAVPYVTSFYDSTGRYLLVRFSLTTGHLWACPFNFVTYRIP